jgi:glutaredoxin 3
MATQQKRVVVFTTPSCPWCRKTKEYLRKNNIRFKEIDVTKDPSSARDIVRRTGQRGVPVILINNRPIVGFNKELLDRLLEIKKR